MTVIQFGMVAARPRRLDRSALPSCSDRHEDGTARPSSTPTRVSLDERLKPSVVFALVSNVRVVS
jgi:hypothetical protein